MAEFSLKYKSWGACRNCVPFLKVQLNNFTDTNIFKLFMTMETMINKAFILSKTSLPPFSNWMSCELQNGMFLYYDKKLPVASNSRKSVILIGDAWQIDSERAKPEEIIHNLNGNERPEVVFSIESTWSGRYILIVGDWLYLDAIGSMACFYGNGMISNSINLIRKVSCGEISYPEIKHGQAPDFLLGPYTLYIPVG